MGSSATLLTWDAGRLILAISSLSPVTWAMAQAELLQGRGKGWLGSMVFVSVIRRQHEKSHLPAEI